MVKNCLLMQETQETWVRFLGKKDPLEEGMATHSRILAWRIPWTGEPGRLQSMGSQRVRLTTRGPYCSVWLQKLEIMSIKCLIMIYYARTSYPKPINWSINKLQRKNSPFETASKVLSPSMGMCVCLCVCKYACIRLGKTIHSFSSDC